MRKLQPIGEGSMAERFGYNFESLVSWLEEITRTESEKGEKSKKYADRASQLEEAVNILGDLCSEN